VAIVTDTFAGTANPIGAPWVTGANGWAGWLKASGVARPDAAGAGEHLVRYGGAGLGADQYCQITFGSTPAASSWYGACARVTSGGSCYAVVHNGGTVYIYELTNGPNFAELGNFAASFVAADVLRIEVIGTTITAKKNGAVIGSRTDATITSGEPGMYGYIDVTTDGIVGFEAGDIGGGAAAPPHARGGPRIPHALLAR
jgi:hypothetical protein